jgi:hypothetical protein
MGSIQEQGFDSENIAMSVSSYAEANSLTSNAGSETFNRPYHYIESIARAKLGYTDSDIGDSFHPDSISAK